MKYEFKKGDKLKVIEDGNSTHISKGMIVTCMKDIFTNNDSSFVTFLMPNEEKLSRYVYRFEKITNPKPLAPTHVVIWEEDRDPARLFTSEKEAKDFIKELSEKSNVKKDSILLIEIKSCRKVSIKKSLNYSQHKI